MTVAAVDESGGISISVSRQSEAGADDCPWRTTRISGSGFRDGENGWGGVVLDEGGQRVGVARQWQRSLSIYDTATGGLIRTLHTSFGPNSVSWLGAGGAGLLPGAEGLIAVAEHKCVSLWDLRVGSTAPRAACVQRLIPTATSPLYSVNWARGVVGCCGGDRSVYVYDPRRWAIRGRAMGVTKTQAMSVSFSAVDPRLYFVHGADTQLVCGQWDDAGGPSLVEMPHAKGVSVSAASELVPISVSTGGHKGTHVVTGGSLRRVFEFRSVGRWIATHKPLHSDSFFGVCDQQALYVMPALAMPDLLAFSAATNKRKRAEDEADCGNL